MQEQPSDEELFFGSPSEPAPPKKGKQESPYSIIANNLNDVERRLRILEERYTNIRRKTQLIDHNMLDAEKRLGKEIKTVIDSVNGLKFQIQEISEKLALLNSEFENLAKKRDLQVVEKYLDLWQPMQFVTREELKRTLEERKK